MGKKGKIKKIIKFSAPSANGFSSEWTYREEQIILLDEETDINETIFNMKRKFCLKYGVELDSVKTTII